MLPNRTKGRAILAGAAALAMLATVLPAPAVATHDDVPGVGAHLFKFNIIGRPNDYNGDGESSNGKALFISLESENKQKSNGEPFVCESDPSFEEEDEEQDPFQLVSNKERIRFAVSEDGNFHMVDRDATDDNWAEIHVPAGIGDMHVAVRMLGKPGGCADFDGVAEETTEAGTRYWWTGTIHAKRNTGTPDKIDVSEIFDVSADFDGDGVVSQDETDVSVFDAMFSDYFWEVTNSGLKNMQVIFYSAE